MVSHLYIDAPFIEDNMKRRAVALKGLGLFIFMIFLVNVFASSLLAAGDVAYIYKRESKIDQNVVGVFNNLGLTVDLIDETKLPVDFKGYKLIFVGDERFKNQKLIPVSDYPSIITNYYFGSEFGLTDRDGISQLAANSPLSVVMDHKVTQVYTSSSYRGSTVSLPYYFLANENKASGFDRVAGAFSGPQNGDDAVLGDVISNAKPGTKLVNGKTTKGNICFFGIVESDYWTPAAKKMFEDCISFVGVACKNNNECVDKNVGGPYCVGDDVYQDVEDFSCVNPGTVQSACVDDLVNQLVKSCSGSCQTGQCVCLDKDSDGYDECNIGDDDDDGKIVDCNDNDASVHPNGAEICDGKDNDCDAQTDEGSDLCETGQVCSSGMCVEVACYDNDDCGTNGLVGNKFCQGNAVYQNFQTFMCSSPGTATSSCSASTSPQLVTQCSSSEVCSEGACIDMCEDNDTDDYDDCSIGTPNDDGKIIDCNDNDASVHPNGAEICDGKDNDCDGQTDEGSDLCGTGQVCSAGQCTAVTCSGKTDCGTDGFIGDKFCQGNAIYQEFRTFMCANAGSASSSCSDSESDVLVKNCLSSEVCESGACIDKCEDKDSDDYDDCGIGTDDDDGKIVDCNDNDASVHPNGAEICDGKDNDCDGQTDETNGNCPAGQLCSFGSCTAVNCNSKSDCGTDGFIDGLFCDPSGKNVTQNFITWSCENPGTISSFCVNEVEARSLFTCNGMCSNGACVSITCQKDSDCNDSDAYTKDSCVNPGQVTSYCAYQDIACLTNSDCNDNLSSTTDVCVNPGKVTSYCVNEGVTCSSKNDCGTDGFIDGFFCSQDDVYRNYVTWSCEYPGTTSSSCSQQVTQRLVEACSDSCSQGSCVSIVCDSNDDCNDFKPGTTDVCVNPGTADSFCTHGSVACNSDNQCGLDKFTGNLFCQGDDLYRNFVDYSCTHPGQTSSFCSNDVEGKFVRSCTYACNDGACVRCTDDSYCDDANANTLDSCRFAGTINSYCSHEIVKCTDDLDCGVDGFSGNKFCKSGDVYQNFKSFMCANPGTTVSSCSSNGVAKLVEDCNFGCSKGSCIVETQCMNNEDDDDDDLIDEEDPGCWDDPADQSTYDPFNNNEARYTIACSINADCGTDGFVGNKFCSQTDVYKNKKVFTCENPGTGIAQCSDETIKVLIDDCSTSETCNQGQCVQVACNGKTDCGTDGFVGNKFCQGNAVYQNFKSFMCSNPGTAVSSCSSESAPTLITTCSNNQQCNNGACITACVDTDGDTYDTCGVGSPGDDSKPVDCNDNNAGINPGASDVQCNGVDNDCDGQIDEGYVSATTNCGVGECAKTGTKSCVNGNEVNSCTAGSPVAEICDGKDNDCDGQSDEQGNLCSAGSVCSFGSCMQIACSSKTDCGTDGFIGNQFCSTSDVYQNFRTFTCNNPGTISSSCSSSTESRLKTECDFSCSNGACTGECNANSDCSADFHSGNYCSVRNVVRDFHDFSCVNHGCTENIVTQQVQACSDLCTNGACVAVACDANSDCGTDGFSGNRFCQGNQVRQQFTLHSCLNPGAASSSCNLNTENRVIETCDNNEVCNNGACVAVACNSNNNCGTNGPEGNRFCQSGDVYQNFRNFMCNNAGTATSSCSSNTNAQLVDDCTLGEVCSNGACVDRCDDTDNDGYDDCSVGTPDDDGRVVDCNDNNAGINPGASDVQCNGVDNDCDGQIDEGYVSATTNCGVGECAKTGTKSCVNGNEVNSCTAGSPVAEICDGKDNDCDGQSDEQGNLCSPGSVCSFGSCMQIACSTNSNCGTDGFIGNQFCSTDDVYQNYRTFTCNNPGTISSSCSSSTESRLKNACDFSCSNGACTGECNTNSDCTADFNSGNYCSARNVVKDFHDFSCVNHACTENIVTQHVQTCSDLCTNGACVAVACDANSDCGTNGVDGGRFCQTGDVYQNFKSFMCANPGTATSSCSSSANAQLVDDCTGNEICNNGACVAVACNGNTDCGTNGIEGSAFCQNGDVYKNFRSFMCTNAGTSTSSCSSSTNAQLVEDCTGNKICSDGACVAVVCNSNTDCGTNGLEGNKFCQSGDVYQNFKSFMCANPGTATSSCSNSANAQLVEDCATGKVCNNGACITACVDTDGDTYDTCGVGSPGDDSKPVDCNDNNAGINPGASDVQCNGVDNDCDGQIDEGYVSATTNCGVGECAKTGTKSCVNGNEVNSCTAGSPVAEICDGKDNDCDGQSDEGFGNETKVFGREPWVLFGEVETELHRQGKQTPKDLLGGRGGSAYIHDDFTLKKICNIFGYSTYVASDNTSSDGRTIWTNGGDSTYKWKDNIRWERIDDLTGYRNPFGLSWVASVTCKERLLCPAA